VNGKFIKNLRFAVANDPNHPLNKNLPKYLADKKAALKAKRESVRLFAHSLASRTHSLTQQTIVRLISISQRKKIAIANFLKNKEKREKKGGAAPAKGGKRPCWCFLLCFVSVSVL
jgi:hypothetical protein